MEPTHDPARILFLVRLPEALTAFFVGGALGLSGLLFQTVLRNPLAEPYVLGVAGGAALGAVLMTILLGVGFTLGGGLPLRAGASFLLGATVLLALLRATRGNPRSLLLGGVVANTVFASLARALTAWLSPSQLAYVTTFLIGFIPTMPLWSVCLVAIPGVAGLVRYTASSDSLDLLLLSHDEAASLGLRVVPFRREVLLAATVLSAASVALAGMMGFVGLVAPHVSRLLTGPGHRALVPLSFLTGGIFLMAAHGLTQSLSRLFLIPAGVATTLIGAPFFLWLLLRPGRGGAA